MTRLFIKVLLALPLLTTFSIWAEPTVNIGVLSFRSAEKTTQQWQPLASYLSEELNRKVNISNYTHQDLEAAILKYQLDVVITNPAHYVFLQHHSKLSSPLATKVTTLNNYELDAFGGVIFTRSDSGASSSLADLNNAHIAVSSINAFGGYIMQAYEMTSAGLVEPQLDNLLITGAPHDRVVNAVLSNKADVGFVRTGVLESLVRDGKLDFTDIHIINQQNLPNYPLATSTHLYPEWPVAVTLRVDDALAQDLTIALLSLKESSSVSTQTLSYNFSTPKNYAEVEKLLQTMRVKPFDTYSPISLRDLWRHYASWIITVLLLSIVLISAGLRLIIQNKLIRSNEKKRQISQQQLEYAINGAQLGYWDWNYQTGEHYVNDRWLSMLGLTREDINNDVSDWEALIHPEDKQYMLDTVQAHIQSGESYAADFRMRHRDEYWVWIEGSGAVVEYDYKTREPLRLCGTHQDISQRKLTEKQLHRSSQVFNHSHESILITDQDFLIIDVNPAFLTITGYNREDVIGQNPFTLFSINDNQTIYNEILHKLMTQSLWQGELWTRKKNGDLFAQQLSYTSIQDENGLIINYIGMFTDITSTKRHQEKLEFIANYDALTGLPNRNLFIDRFHQAIAHSNRTQQQLAVCFLDLDNFKPVNDNFGHEIGDQLLIEVAQRIQDNIRDEDTVSRQGGDEFTLLLNDIQSFEECEHTLKRIHQSLSAPIIIDDIQHRISASSGITLYPIDDSDIDTLLRHADHAMYQSKQLGRNRYHLFNPQHDQELTYKHQLLHDIEQAFHDQQFELYYQPKINMLTGEVFGVEALIRWSHPEKGLIPPLEFLPIIESTELEIIIGDWVIEQALHQLEEWQEQYINLEVSVNIASHHLQSTTFIEKLKATLAEFPTVNSHSLQLEILESSALGDLTATRKTIRSCLHDLGVYIALDDFGTGYSSLTHLRNLPVNTIKIDQSFVRDMLEDVNDYVIIDSVIALSASFGRSVIAEGVETTEQGQMLIEMGCHLAQGYAISRPLPVKQFNNWLSNYQPNTEWINYKQTNSSQA